MKVEALKKVLRITALLVLIALALAGSYFHFLDPFELETLDLRFRLRPPIPATDKIAIIEIGDDTIRKLGRFPFDRSYHAVLVKALVQAGAKAIVFDLFFSEPQKTDAEFARVVKNAGNVYFPLVFELDRGGSSRIPIAKEKAVQLLESLSKPSKGEGHINVVPDIDGKYRRAPAYIEYGDKIYPYLGLKVVCDYLGIPENKINVVPGKYVDLGDGLRMDLDENSMLLINFSGPWGSSYKHYSYVDILQSYLAGMTGAKPNIDLGALKDKVCIIGLTAIGTVDLHPNQFDALYPAVGMHAEVFNSVLNNNFARRAPRAVNLAILIFLSALISVLVLKTKPLRGFFILFSIISIYVLSCMLIFNYTGIWLDIIYPVFIVVAIHLTLTIYKYIHEWKRRLLIENELEIAKKIQESFLPDKTPSVEGIEVSACMFTARQVGGDLYDFIEQKGSLGGQGANRLGVMIGDVSGKGVPAALFMAMVVGAFRSFAISGARPEDAIANLNAKLVKESTSNLFVTLFYTVFDMDKMVAFYGNGGHMPLVYLPKAGSTQFLDVTDGAPLGLMDGPYSGGQMKFGEGDIFVFYTDGITEAMNDKSDMYGKERLQKVIEDNSAMSAKRLVEAIEKDVRKFEPKASQHDDMTIIVVRIK